MTGSGFAWGAFVGFVVANIYNVGREVRSALRDAAELIRGARAAKAIQSERDD